MSREWKPGDVAMVTCSDGQERIAFCVTDQFSDRLDWWFGNRVFRYVANSEARPVVVIDPEDMDQVERLRSEVGGHLGALAINRIDEMQKALRALVADPKPEEPTGLGAVVRDADGKRWCRFADEYDNKRRWSPASALIGNRSYADITAVEVLSHGVQP